MNISRRKFLRAAPLLGGAVLGLSNITPGQSKMALSKLLFRPEPGDVLARLNWEAFSRYTNTVFTFRQKGREIRMILASMENTTPPDALAGQECFVLTFSGKRRFAQTQATYPVDHFALGKFDLFISEAEASVNGNYYTAVINRVIS